MNTAVRTTYALVGLSVVYVLLFYFTVDMPNNSFGYALGRGLFIWIVAGIVVAVRWLYCKAFKKQGDYLKQLNWSALVMIVLSIVLWARNL